MTQFDYIALRDLGEAITAVADRLQGRMLDYGCGTRPYESLFVRSTAYEGADFPDNGERDWTLGPGGELPAELTHAFDGVVSFQVLEHVPDTSLYLEECSRVLRPDGMLLLTTHGIWEYHPGPDDLWRWTMEGLKRTLAAHRFHAEHSVAITTGWRSVLQQAQVVLRGSRLRRAGAPLRVVLNVLASFFPDSRRSMTDANSLAICYLVLARRTGEPRDRASVLHAAVHG